MYSNFAMVSAGLGGQSEWATLTFISADAEMTLLALLQNSSNFHINSWKPCALKNKEKKQWTESHEWNEESP